MPRENDEVCFEHSGLVSRIRQLELRAHDIHAKLAHSNGRITDLEKAAAVEQAKLQPRVDRLEQIEAERQKFVNRIALKLLIAALCGASLPQFVQILKGVL